MGRNSTTAGWKFLPEIVSGASAIDHAAVSVEFCRDRNLRDRPCLNGTGRNDTLDPECRPLKSDSTISGHLWREEPSKAAILNIAFARPLASPGACQSEFGLHLARVGGAHQRSERTTLDASVGATDAANPELKFHRHGPFKSWIRHKHPCTSFII